MKTASAKNKGRELQKLVRDMYRNLGREFGLVDGDIESRGMGQPGVDIILSPFARSLFSHDIECKRHRRTSVGPLFKEHFEKYKDIESLKLLYHQDNYSDTLVTMRAEDFFSILKQAFSRED